MLTFRQWCVVTEGATQALSKVIPGHEVRAVKSDLEDTMPQGKVKHSLRVGATLAKIGVHPSTVKAAVFHDYLERGGNAEKLHHHLDPHGVSLVHHLSDPGKNGKGNGPLDHAKHVLSHPAMTPKMKNDFIVSKMSDRLDNLKRRHDTGGISDKFRDKSDALVKHLARHYTGDHDAINHMKKRFKDYGIHIKKKHIGPEV